MDQMSSEGSYGMPITVQRSAKEEELWQGILTDFGRAIEPTDEVRGDLVLGRVGGGAQVAKLDHGLALVDLNILN